MMEESELLTHINKTVVDGLETLPWNAGGVPLCRIYDNEKSLKGMCKALMEKRRLSKRRGFLRRGVQDASFGVYEVYEEANTLGSECFPKVCYASC